MMVPRKLPPWALVVALVVALLVLVGVVSLAVDFDLPAWAQRVLTCLGLSALVVGLALPHIGVAMLREDPASVWGRRLVSAGVAGRHTLERVAGILSPTARRILESFPEAEVPSGVAASVRVEQGASLTVRADPGSVVTTSPQDPQIRRVVPPRLPLLLLCLAMALTGCADLTYARSVRDSAHGAAMLAAPVVELRCVAQQARDLAEVRALPEHSAERERRAEEAVALQRERRCPETVDAYDALRTASITLDATVAVAETGQCMSARSASCDVGGATVKAAQATAAVAALIEHLEKSR